MDHIPEPSGKSLLLQTVALFETLLLKIQSMKNEKETMTEENLRLTSCLKSKCTVEDDLKVTEARLQSVNEVREGREGRAGRKKVFCNTFSHSRTDRR